VARRLALIAHDNKKVDFVAWATFNRETLSQFELIGTRHTARLVRDKVGLEIEELLSGPEGGDLEIGAMIVQGEIDAVVFLRDPLTSHPHEPDIQAVLKVCDVHDVPLATNRASALLLIRSLHHELTQ